MVNTTERKPPAGSSCQFDEQEHKNMLSSDMAELMKIEMLGRCWHKLFFTSCKSTDRCQKTGLRGTAHTRGRSGPVFEPHAVAWLCWNEDSLCLSSSETGSIGSHHGKTHVCLLEGRSVVGSITSYSNHLPLVHQSAVNDTWETRRSHILSHSANAAFSLTVHRRTFLQDLRHFIRQRTA